MTEQEFFTYIKGITLRVEVILKNHERARNEDNYLVAMYWYYYEQDKLHKDHTTLVNGKPRMFLFLDDLTANRLTSISTIERARRKIQEKACLLDDIELMKNYLPTDWDVIKQRRIRSKQWRDYINGEKIKTIIEKE